METNQNIKKIKLANGDIYSIFDEGALRLGDVDSEGNAYLLTNNPYVDNIILDTGLTIEEVDDVPVEVLNPQVIFRDPSTHELLKADLETAQIKLGIKEYALQQTSGTLWLGARDAEGHVIHAVFD